MNLILEKSKQVSFYTNMELVFSALGVSASDYDWYVSDIETNYYGNEFESKDQWIEGSLLQNFVQNNKVQFIWAVFSAVSKGSRFDVTNPPYIEGNSDYWCGKEITPQLEDALFEIACWDSSATIFVGLPATLESNFKSIYTDVKSLISAAR
jgi:hypothetical protein